MAGMEKAQVQAQAANLLVAMELDALRERVLAASAALAAERQHHVHEIEAEAAPMKRMRTVPGQHPAAPVLNPNEQAEHAFSVQLVGAEERLQSAQRAELQHHLEVQRVRATIDAAKASAGPLLALVAAAGPVAERLAALLETRNEERSALLKLPAQLQLLALSQLSVVQLWRARAVSRQFYHAATEVLKGLPWTILQNDGPNHLVL